MNLRKVTELDQRGRNELADELPDTPVNAIPVGVLRTGAGPAYRSGDSALVALSGEGTGFGDPDEILEMLRSIKGCTSVLLPTSDAQALAQALTVPPRFVEDVQYVLKGEPHSWPISDVRVVRGSEIPSGRRVELFGDTDVGVLDQGTVACVYVDGEAVAQANSLYRSNTYGDIGVKTIEEFRGRGFATAAAFRVASSLCEQGLKPVWSTSADNAPSRRIAEKLGFTVVSTQHSVVPEGGEWS